MAFSKEMKHPSGKKYRGLYLEGARGHCWGCGRPKKEHRDRVCPVLRERNDWTAVTPKRFNGGIAGVIR